MGTTFETADTQHVEAAGIRFAYRKFGAESGVPLVFLQHFTGTMDAWDPSVVNALAAERPVVVFNNAGVGTSTGMVPNTIEQMSADAERFMAALGLTEVDLLGFSLGGFLAQVIASRSKIKVRKLIVAGSAPRGGEEHLLQVVGEAFSQNARDVRLPLFFTPSDASQIAGATFLDRVTTRRKGRDPESGDSVSNPQAAAIIEWCANKDTGHTMLRAIQQPTLIVHGSNDTMFPSINAYEMFKHMRTGTLIIYPDSGHGALFQYPETFVAHVQTFLNS